MRRHRENRPSRKNEQLSQDLFDRLAEMKESVDEEEVKAIKTAILREMVDRIDKMNSIRKQYLSDYYIVVYGKNELDLENTTINIVSEINKCGLNAKLLCRSDTAIFLTPMKLSKKCFARAHLWCIISVKNLCYIADIIYSQMAVMDSTAYRYAINNGSKVSDALLSVCTVLTQANIKNPRK